MAPPSKDSWSTGRARHRNVVGAGTGAITRSKGNGKQKKSFNSTQWGQDGLNKRQGWWTSLRKQFFPPLESTGVSPQGKEPWPLPGHALWPHLTCPSHRVLDSCTAITRLSVPFWKDRWRDPKRSSVSWKHNVISRNPHSKQHCLYGKRGSNDRQARRLGCRKKTCCKFGMS